MKKFQIYVIALIFTICGLFNIFNTNNSFAQSVQTTIKSEAPIVATSKNTNVDETICVGPLEIIATPQNYLNKNIKMSAIFDKFSTLGLDYPPALRKSEEYIGILIRRDDVTDHVMPLPEMKIFLARKTAEKYIDLESGDKIEIEGKVFSTAMGDAWIDINKLTVISSKKPIKAS